MPRSPGDIRWGVLGTANIAQSNFLPALRSVGGRARAVAGRDPERTREFAQRNEIDIALDGYQALIDDPELDAVYNPLPNSLHAEWTIAALRAGKAVLCEKPLCMSVAETEAVLNVARETEALLWEAFVFPFQPQMQRIQQLVGDGEIGEILEIQSSFHFLLNDPGNFRFRPELGGGGLLDVGCYCIHLATQLLHASPDRAVAAGKWSPEGVDIDLDGVEVFPDGKHLVFACGMSGPNETLARILGSTGEIRIASPFHAGPGDVMEIITPSGRTVEHLGLPGPSFAPALRHINAAIAGEVAPEHLAIDDSMPTQIGLQLARDAARTLSTR